MFLSLNNLKYLHIYWNISSCWMGRGPRRSPSLRLLPGLGVHIRLGPRDGLCPGTLGSQVPPKVLFHSQTFRVRMEQEGECLPPQTWLNNMTSGTPQLPAWRSCQQDPPELKIAQPACVAACCHRFWQSVVLHHPPLKDLTASPLSWVLLEPPWSVSIATAMTCSTLSACISRVIRLQTNAQQRQTHWRQEQLEVVKPWLSLIGTNKTFAVFCLWKCFQPSCQSRSSCLQESSESRSWSADQAD